MNIDYSEIITKANARKDALQALGKELEFAEGHAADLFDALEYFANLRPLVDAIDVEGRDMIAALSNRLYAVSYRCGETYKTLAFPENTGSDRSTMSGLLKALKGPNT